MSTFPHIFIDYYNYVGFAFSQNLNLDINSNPIYKEFYYFKKKHNIKNYIIENIKISTIKSYYYKIYEKVILNVIIKYLKKFNVGKTGKFYSPCHSKTLNYSKQTEETTSIKYNVQGTDNNTECLKLLKPIYCQFKEFKNSQYCLNKAENFTIFENETIVFVVNLK